jgi:hypothetical protein
MDSLHRKPQDSDSRLGRNCAFCQRFDPGFDQRPQIDKLIWFKGEDRAGSHLSENGYVRHRLVELSVRFPAGAQAFKSGAA